jgi:hypothetical protein
MIEKILRILSLILLLLLQLLEQQIGIIVHFVQILG